MHRTLASFVLLSLLTPATALASEPKTSPANVEASDQSSTQASRPTWRTRRDVSFGVRPGVFYDGHGAGITAGADVLYRRGLVVLGVVGETAAAAFLMPYRYAGGGGAVGVSAPTASWLRADLLYVMGAHAYSGVGGTPPWTAMHLYAESPSSATLPFAGARLRVSANLGSSARFQIGVEALAETDFVRVRRNYQITEWSLFHQERRTATRTVGTERVGAALVLGGAFDL